MNTDHRTSQNEAAAAYTELVLIVLRVGARLAEAAERTAAAGGLTAARWQVLTGVLNEPRPVAEIARRVGLTRQSVQSLADALVRDGYAHWESNPRHRRAKLLAPTPRGHRAIRRIASRQDAWTSGISDGIGAHELRRAARVLRRVLNAMQEHPPA
jgi:DNA-binding MarR family transcriptional regulator